MNLHHNRDLYRMLDDRSGATPAIHIDEGSTGATWRKALKWNEEKFGIFWTVNRFKTPGDRKKENVDRILSWSADIDAGTKAEQKAIISKFLEPSMIVETKSGYHVYYDAIDAAIENYELIESKFIVPSLGADPKARDLSRILRVPHFYHWKDPANPFFCKIVHLCDKKYTESQIMASFKDHRDEKQEKHSQQSHLKRSLRFQKDGSLWERIWNMNCEDALMRLSGSDAVGGEIYSFRQNANGNKNILVNGKGSSCFIDSSGRIGSLDGGGPTVWNWLFWFHKNNSKVYYIIKTTFPEVIK